jgi:hypothetical protein
MHPTSSWLMRQTSLAELLQYSKTRRGKESPSPAD